MKSEDGYNVTLKIEVLSLVQEVEPINVVVTKAPVPIACTTNFSNPNIKLTTMLENITVRAFPKVDISIDISCSGKYFIHRLHDFLVSNLFFSILSHFTYV